MASGKYLALFQSYVMTIKEVPARVGLQQHRMMGKALVGQERG